MKSVRISSTETWQSNLLAEGGRCGQILRPPGEVGSNLFRNKVFSDMDTNFLSIDPLIEVRKSLGRMEFDISKILFDTDDRKNKYPSPICFFVPIPNDIRVLYKKESPYFDLQGCFHETGHAIHANSIDVNNEYWDKYRIPMGIEEIFSIFLESIC